MEDRVKLLAKIKKCLSLAKSGNENEAATALRQAKVLMQKYAVTEGEVLASDVIEMLTRAGAKAKPVRWECDLAAMVADFFGCKIIFKGGLSNGHWCFIGEHGAPDIAQYAFAVLLRQIKAARKDYAALTLSRCKPATRVRRADIFCDGWVSAVRRKTEDFASSYEPTPAVTAYLQAKYPQLNTLKPVNRTAGKRISQKEEGDWFSGRDKGRQAQLNHGVSAGKNEQLRLS